MRYLRITGDPDLSIAAESFQIIANSEHIQEARLQAYNLGGGEITFLHRIDGDVTAARAELADTEQVLSVSANHIGESTGYLLTRIDPTGTVFAEKIYTLLTSSNLVILTPVVYREGAVRLQLVGEDEEIQFLMDNIPPDFGIEVHEISGTIAQQTTVADSLSSRQREALRVALSLGYYDQPRAATHEDVAEELGCAPSTASEHLQKAQAALVQATIVDHTPE